MCNGDLVRYIILTIRMGLDDLEINLPDIPPEAKIIETFYEVDSGGVTYRIGGYDSLMMYFGLLDNCQRNDYHESYCYDPVNVELMQKMLHDKTFFRGEVKRVIKVLVPKTES